MPSTQSAIPSLGKPLATPPGFPVEWADPAQAGQLWMLDRMHFGAPLLPLVADIYRSQVAAGFNRTAERLGFPVRIAFLYLNSYLYNSHPTLDLPPEVVQKALNRLGRVAPTLFNRVQGQVVKGMTAKYMVHIEPLMSSLDSQWEKNWRPEIQQQMAFWRDFDLAAASPSALLTHLEESLRRLERLWALHFEILVPSLIALSQFVDDYQGILDSRPEAAADSFTLFALLQGSNSYLQADQALWQLSRQARTMPVVRKTLQEHPAAEVIPLLNNQVEGQIFLAELCAWLESYGQRGHGPDGLGEVSWLEDPTPVIQMLQGNLSLPDQDLLAEIQAQAADRDQRIAQARQRLQSRPSTSAKQSAPDDVLAEFDRRLYGAQWGEYLLTEHNFWIDQMAMVRVRLVFLEIGRRLLATGMLDEAREIFYLTLDELFTMARSAATSSASDAARQNLLAQRKRQFDDAHTLVAPDALGTMPWLAPPDEPFVRAMTRLFGHPLIPVVAPMASGLATPLITVRGQAASAGTVRGRARVIRTLDEAERLQRGDILVTVATMPPWTPLLAIAGAVVTDAGGILSHAAIIAREIGIPAVVATRNGSELIQDGQWLEVDGSTGIVQILAAPPEVQLEVTPART